jgi:hypothetical protein
MGDGRGVSGYGLHGIYLYSPLKLRGDERGVKGVMNFLRNDPTLKPRRRELRRNQTETEKALWAYLRDR